MIPLPGIKVGVSLANLVPQMAVAYTIVAFVMAEWGIPCIITSGNDGKHGENSLHYRDGLCRALDFRTKHFNGWKPGLRDAVKTALGENFDVVLEDLGGENEHLHVEYDPKVSV
jgi:hypothetical protein